MRPSIPPDNHRRPSGSDPDVIDAHQQPTADRDAPSLARTALTVVGHTSSRAAGAYVRATRRVVGAAVAPATSIELVRDLAAETTRALQTAAAATDLDRRLEEAGLAGALVRRVGQVAVAFIGPDPAQERDEARLIDSRRTPGRPLSLREQGEELLRRSRDVNDAYEAHPAYARMLSELAPDEARILQLMLIDGPQPTVDVRTGGPLGLINSRLIAPGLSMIGARAGCRYVDRVPSYLNNLFRLGLIWFSHETLRDHQRYQVLEAQPDVLAAIHSVAAAKVIRRSVHLTPFGEDFCRVCLSDGASALPALPEHSSPRTLHTAPQPPSANLDGGLGHPR